jgi:superfamily II DNA or RNA helicase
MSTLESIAETLKDWLHEDFDSATVQRGLRVLGAGLVRNVDIEKRHINAAVGSEQLATRVYRQRIVLDGDLLYSDCSCPVGNDCKHVAAVILAIMDQVSKKGGPGFLDFGAASPQIVSRPKTPLEPVAPLPPPDPLDSPLLRHFAERRTILEVSKSTSSKASSQGQRKGTWAQDRPYVPSWPDYGKPADFTRWSMGYCIMGSGGLGAYPALDRWVVTPILIYRKVDGTAGRLKAWGPGYAGLPVPPGAEALDDILAAFPDRQAPVMVAGLLLVDLVDLVNQGIVPLFISHESDPASAVRARIRPGAKAHLGFEPFTMDKDEPCYKPVLSFYEDDVDSSGPGLGRPVRQALLCPGAMLYLGDDTIYPVRSGPLSKKAFVDSLGRPGDFNLIRHSQAPAIIEALAASAGDQLALASIPSRVELVKSAPQVEVLLSFGEANRHVPARAVCTFRFTYLGSELGDESRVLRRAGEVLEVIERDEVFERETVAFFRRLAGDLAVPPERTTGWYQGRQQGPRHARQSDPFEHFAAFSSFTSIDPAEPFGKHQASLDQPEVLINADLPRFAAELYGPMSAAGYRFLMYTEGKPKPLKKAKLVAMVASKLDWFEATMRLDMDGRGIPLDGAAVYLGSGLMYLGGHVVVVDDADRSLLALLASARMGNTASYRVDRRDLGRMAALHGVADDSSRDLTEESAQLYSRLAGLTPTEPEPVPAGLQATLRPYQQKGYEWLLRLARSGLGALLADDMGLGKTVQAATLLLRLQEDQLLRPALIVAPVTVLHNWTAELERFAPSLRAFIHHGPGRTSTAPELAAMLLTHDIVLTSYQTLRSDIQRFRTTEWGLCLLDEAQMVKNPEAAVSKAVRSLRSRVRLILTGTPVENRPLDLWSHFAFLNPGLLGNRKSFVAEYERPIAAGDEDALEAMRRRTLPFILRRSKAQVLDDLPPKEEIIRWIDLDPRQKSFYEGLRKDFADQVGRVVAEKGLKNSVISILEALLRLRQAAIHPGLVSPDHGVYGGSKIDAAADLVAELLDGGHKVLVFSQFVKALSLLRARLDGASIPYEYLDGQSKDRQERIKRFQSGQGAGAFLLSLKAGGVGINLTSADYVLLLDPWWNPAVESQAVDRAHRIGQKSRVTIYRLVSKGTVEEKVLLLQDRKRRLVEELVAKGADGLAGMSGEDIMGLFEA